MAPDDVVGASPGARRRRGRSSAPVALVVLVFMGVALIGGLLTACSPGSGIPASEAPPVTDAPPPVVFVTMGGIETLNTDRDDLPDNWTQLVFSDVMRPGGVHVNLATEDATVHSALDGQLPEALELHATVATIWLESADFRLGTSMRVYRDELTTLVEDLQAGGVRVYLLRSGTDTDPAPLQASVAVVAAETGATLVDLGDVSDRFEDEGQRHIADIVGAALRSDLGG